MDWTPVWDILDKLADALGVVSFIISIPTLVFAKSTKKAIQEHDDIKEYKDEIDGHIKELSNIYTTLKNGDIYNEKLLRTLQSEIDAIQIQYKSVLKPFNREIKNLLSKIESAIKNITPENSDYNKNSITRSLNKIIEHLKKVKKGI